MARRITIGFSKSNSLWSYLIRLHQGTSFSHCYLRWITSYGPGICYHADCLNVRFMSDVLFKKNVQVVEEFDFEISDEDFAGLMRFCLETAGIGYAFMELVDLLFGTNYFSSGAKKQYCAELIYRALNHILWEEQTKDADRIRLSEIYEMVKSLSAVSSNGKP